ncbi:MAG: DNA polymerase I, partial [Luteimonas sp.]
QEYGSLAGIMENADKIGGVVGANLRAALEWLPKGRELITVKCDCDLSAHMMSISQSLGAKDEDREQLIAFFTKYGFKTLLRELSGLTPAAPPAGSAAAGRAAEPAPGATADLFAAPPATISYETVLTEAQLEAWIARIDAAGLTALDTETTSLDPMLAEMVGISLSVEPGIACYIPLAHRYPDAPHQLQRDWVLSKLKPWLEDAAKPKLGQNLKYDAHIFANHGVTLRGIVHDTLLQSYVFESHRTHDMDSLALRHLNHKTIAYEEVCGKGASQIGFDQVEIGRATEYAAEDADITLRLHLAMHGQVAGDEGLTRIYSTIELPTAVVLQKIERNGVLIDAGLLATQSSELGARILQLEQQAYELAGQPFNLGSPKQIGEIFFTKLELPIVKKTPSGAPSTDEEVLQKLAEDFPLPKVLLEYRGMAKLKSTYTDKLPKMINKSTGRVHTNYAQAVAITGRLASNDPNLQNIPVRTAEGRRIREAFIAPPGSHIVSADYSQIELRIMAHISGDEAMLRAFADGEDIHRATAAEIFGMAPSEVQSEQRRYAKVINFGLIYGMSAFGLAANLGIERSAATSYIERYFARYPAVKRYMDQTRAMARTKGYVQTMLGRRVWLPEINSPNGPRRSGAERQAINAPMQGTAADIIKRAMITIDQWIADHADRAKMILQVHDELVFEADLDFVDTLLAEVVTRMTRAGALRVPLVVDSGIGDNWDEAH